MSDQTRISWIDESTQLPVIDEYARKLDSFAETFADGAVDETELKSQEERLTELWKEIEPTFKDVAEISLGDSAVGLVALSYHDCIGRHMFCPLLRVSNRASNKLAASC